MINVSDDLTGTLLPMLKFQILINPGDEVIFECALDQLMEKVWGDKFMNVSMGNV